MSCELQAERLIHTHELTFDRDSCLAAEGRQHLVAALLKHLPEPSSPVVLAARPEPASNATQANRSRKGLHSSKMKHSYDPTTAFILELSTVLASRDKTSIVLLGESVADALQTLLRGASRIDSGLLSRVIFYLFYLMEASQRLQDHALLKTPVVLHTISGFELTTLESVATATLKGLALCLSERSALRSEIVNSPDFWLILSQLHSSAEAAASIFEIVQRIVLAEPVAITADNYISTISLLNSFATAGRLGAAIEQQEARKLAAQTRDRNAARSSDMPPKAPTSQDKEIVFRGFEAVSLIFHMTHRIPGLIERSQLESGEAWMSYWTPVLQRLQGQCLNPCRKIRRQACALLQNALLSPPLSPESETQWFLVFRIVLFGLISRLLKPEIRLADPSGMNETRSQALNILCRTFLHHLPRLAEERELSILWLEILDIMERLMGSSDGDNLEEAIPESLKNMLLVMAGSGILQPPAAGEEPMHLWTETRKAVDRFLPDLIDELFSQKTVSPLNSLQSAVQTDQLSRTSEERSRNSRRGDTINQHQMQDHEPMGLSGSKAQEE